MAIATQRTIDRINEIISPASIAPNSNGFTITNNGESKNRKDLDSACDCLVFWGLLPPDQYHEFCPDSDLLR